MKITEEELKGLLPNIRGLVDPKVETSLYQAFRRVYEFMLLKFSEHEKTIEERFAKANIAAAASQNQFNTLIGAMSQPLVGSGESDPVLQSIISVEGIPPTPPPTQVNANGEILDIGNLVVGQYIRRTGNALVSGVPTGTVNLKDGTLPNLEGVLYTTPVGHKTRIRTIILYNNSAGALTAEIRTRDALSNLIYSNSFPINSLETLNIAVLLDLPAGYTFRGYSTVDGAIEITLFGIEEPN